MTESAGARGAAGGVRAVYLVGAGPGDHNLITLAGARALQEADVILYDRLVSPLLPMLGEHGNDAELIAVGKTPGEPSITQAEIIQLMIDLSRAGKRVVRLKGGDPFVFGRGGEEASALAQAGIPLQLVPGVSSAFAAGAAFGIPVTDRRAASAVTVVTGTESGDAPPLDWAALARVGGTIVILMGWRKLDEIVARLQAAGLAAETPAAAIEQAWTSSQRVVFAPLGELRERAAGMSPPVTVVIGEVAALATPEVSWSIMGRRIVVTRAAAQAGALTQRLQALNADVIELPTIAIQPAEPASVDAAIRQLADGRYAYIALTSVNGVHQLWDALLRQGLDARALGRTQIAAVGSETAAALAQRGIAVDLVPSEFTTEALAGALTEALGAEGLVGRRVLLARSAQGSPLLAERLRAAGALVEDLALYDVVTPSADEAMLAALAELERGVDLVTLTSPSTARGLAQLVDGRVGVDSLQAVCIGPVTAAAARALGFPVAAVAERHTIEGLAQAVGRYIASLGPPGEDDLETEST